MIAVQKKQNKTKVLTYCNKYFNCRAAIVVKLGLEYDGAVVYIVKCERWRESGRETVVKGTKKNEWTKKDLKYLTT